LTAWKQLARASALAHDSQNSLRRSQALLLCDEFVVLLHASIVAARSTIKASRRVVAFNIIFPP
jgi:hypothetical protein